MKMVRCKCGWCGPETEITVPGHCPTCGQHDQMEELTKDSSGIRAHELRAAWLAFGDVPMDPVSEEIEEPFLGFPSGTYRFDIWHWFDRKYPRGLYSLMEEVEE